MAGTTQAEEQTALEQLIFPLYCFWLTFRLNIGHRRQAGGNVGQDADSPVDRTDQLASAGSRTANQAAANTTIAPLSCATRGAPRCFVSQPAAKLPKGPTPKKAIA